MDGITMFSIFLTHFHRNEEVLVVAGSSSRRARVQKSNGVAVVVVAEARRSLEKVLLRRLPTDRRTAMGN